MAAPPRTILGTHEVTNQPPDRGDRNPYATDAALRDAVRREAGDWLDARAYALGAETGRHETMALGEAANRHPPELRVFDRHGRRLDEVTFHPAWHRLMTLAMDHRIHDLAWTEPGPAPHAAHAALLALFTHTEAGVMCPIDMTYASVPVLRARPGWTGRRGWSAAGTIPASSPSPTRRAAATCGRTPNRTGRLPVRRSPPAGPE